MRFLLGEVREIGVDVGHIGQQPRKERNARKRDITVGHRIQQREIPGPRRIRASFVFFVVFVVGADALQSVKIIGSTTQVAKCAIDAPSEPLQPIPLAP